MYTKAIDNSYKEVCIIGVLLFLYDCDIVSVISWINLFRLIITEYTLNMESVPAWLTIGDSNIGSVSRTITYSEAKSANVDQPPRCVSVRRVFHAERSLSAKMGQTLICSHEVVPHLRSQLPLLGLNIYIYSSSFFIAGEMKKKIFTSILQNLIEVLSFMTYTISL
jgi:hypothetical protein